MMSASVELNMDQLFASLVNLMSFPVIVLILSSLFCIYHIKDICKESATHLQPSVRNMNEEGGGERENRIAFRSFQHWNVNPKECILLRFHVISFWNSPKRMHP